LKGPLATFECIDTLVLDTCLLWISDIVQLTVKQKLSRNHYVTQTFKITFSGILLTSKLGYDMSHFPSVHSAINTNILLRTTLFRIMLLQRLQLI